jgi:hypothetical protein
MSYKKSNWVPYDPTLSFEQNVTQGGTTTADKLNNMETGISNNDINKVTDNKDGSIEVNGSSITPADDSKVVHSTDMRKPASDVAGIEEVNTLQTQVNNSAVGINILTNTSDFSSNWIGQSSVSTTTEFNGCPSMVFTSSNQQLVRQPFGLGKLKNSFQYTSSFWAKADNAGDKACTILWGGAEPVDFVLTTNWVRYTAVVTSFFDANTNIDHSMYFFGVPDGNKGNVYTALPKLEKGNVATDWCPNLADKVNVSDMRKPASDVAGIEEVNAKQDKIGYTPADDSTVAHLSGANNFDTVPTVNNKSLATTDDVATASNTVLTSANTSISKLLQSSSNNDEDSAVTNSTSDTSNFYYWTE